MPRRCPKRIALGLLTLILGLVPSWPVARAETHPVVRPKLVVPERPEPHRTLDPAALSASPPHPAARAAAGALPSGIEPGVPVRLAVPGDKPVFVIHAGAENRRPILYMHGQCGNVRAVDSWKQAAAAHGTLIGLIGERPCGGGRFKWSKKLELVRARIERAFAAVERARGGLLDRSQLVLFGYSQGADRAEALVARWPDDYRLVVLGGPSREPRLRHLGATTAVAVFGGEHETTGHMRAGAELLAAAGKPVRFFALPAAKHGEYGPDGNRVIGEVLSFIASAGDERAQSAELVAPALP